MSHEVSHDDLQSQIIHLMFDAMNDDAGWIGPDVIGQNLGIASDRVSLAASRLVKEGYLNARYNIRSGASYQISERAYIEIEQARRDDPTVSDALPLDPIQSLEAQLAPAAGRMVGFGDNQSDLDQAIESIEDAQNAIRESNQLDPDVRDETAFSLDTWKNLIVKARRFAIGAFQFLVWDRIKAVIEGGIEDAYRVALTAILITLGTIIVGLL